jgi:hypothetical protein
VRALFIRKSMAKRPTTNDNIRDLIDNLRLELKGDIKDVANQVSTLDRTVSENALKQAVSSTQIGMLITGITLVVSAITTVIMEKITGRIPS